MQIVHQTIFMHINNIYIKRRNPIFTCNRRKYSKIHERFWKFRYSISWLTQWLQACWWQVNVCDQDLGDRWSVTKISKLPPTDFVSNIRPIWADKWNFLIHLIDFASDLVGKLQKVTNWSTYCRSHWIK